MLRYHGFPTHRRIHFPGEHPVNATDAVAACDEDLFEVALYVYRYARRWAVGQSPHSEDAIIYDACVSRINDECTPRNLGSRSLAPATHDRYLQRGPERHARRFSIPITVEDAVVTLHRYARRYTNGRGTYTAALVNQAARDLLDLGISLDVTRDTDGTIWAADGVDGLNDGLSEAERAEALAALGRTRDAETADDDHDDAHPAATHLSGH